MNNIKIKECELCGSGAKLILCSPDKGESSWFCQSCIDKAYSESEVESDKENK